ncbi:MAG: hypothetical protein HYU88_02125, partial [Chloroflexi bacterium]|nr:hypothetical protein [Chloroflexota bacterium]
MATNIPPHNLGELCDGLSFVIDRYAGCVERGVPFDLVWMRALGLDPELGALVPVVQKLPPALREELAQKAGQSAKRPDRAALAQTLLQWLDDQVDVTPEELSRFIKGPDFPTAGIILGVDGIKNAYATGHGRIVIRARAHVDEPKAGRFQVVVTELPFQVNKAALIEKIADLVRDKRVDGIAELRDESDRQGMRIVIEVKRDAQPRKLLNQLYKHTAMQTAFSVNMLALVDGQPRVLTLKTALLHYVNFRREIVQRRTQFDLEKARQRAHVLEGLKIALDHLDAVIQMIRQARDADAARSALMRQFKLSDAQAQAILDMQLRRLASLERRKILDELKEVRETVAKLEDLLAHPAKILGVVREELQDLKKRFGDVRRTRILQQEVQEFTDEDLIPDVEVVVTVSGRGYVKRLPASTYRVQRRGGRGVTGMVMREDDAVRHVLVANTHDSLLFFTDRGRVFQTKVHELPDASRQARGLPLTNVIGIEANETVTAVMAVRRFLDGQHFVMATRRGEVKRVAVSEFAVVRSSGLIAMGLFGFMQSPEKPYDIRRWLALVGAVYGFLHYAVQGKGWEYHLYPLAVFLCALASVPLAALAKRVEPSR